MSTSRTSRRNEPEPPPELAPVERLRPHRQIHDRAKGLGDAFACLAREHQRDAKRLAGLSELWDALCPPNCIQRTALRPVKRGVLTIAVSDPTTRSVVEKAVKGGLDRELITAAPMTVRAVRVVLARDEPQAGR